MIFAIIFEAVAIFGLIALIHDLEKANAQERADRAAAYEETLNAMANRIQRPDVLPVKAADGFVVPDREPDEWNLIGTVGFDPEYGTE